jgi:hypothetical protein
MCLAALVQALASVKSLAGRLDRVGRVCHLEFGRCGVICIDSLSARFPPFLPGMPHGVSKCQRLKVLDGKAGMLSAGRELTEKISGCGLIT